MEHFTTMEPFRKRLAELWHGPTVVSRGRLLELASLPGFASGQGLATYRIEGKGCELVTLNSPEEGQGVGSALLVAVEERARREGCARVWLITTNDNLEALKFYQKRGYRLCGLHVGAVDESRRLKPGIPQRGANGIPLRDEIELEKPLL